MKIIQERTWLAPRGSAGREKNSSVASRLFCRRKGPRRGEPKGQLCLPRGMEKPYGAVYFYRTNILFHCISKAPVLQARTGKTAVDS